MKTSLLIIAIVMGTSFSAHAGRTLQREVLAAKGGSTKSGSGTNVGGTQGVRYASSVSWCQDQTGTLEDYQDRAAAKLEKRGTYNAANKLLVEGMEEVLAGDDAEGSRDTFFHKSLVRGVEIAKLLGADTTLEDRRSMVVHNILIKYYELLFKSSGKELNTVPYLDMRDRATNYEIAFINYAKDQIVWMLRNIVAQTKTRDGQVVYTPVGDADATLKVMYTLSGAVADDLDESVYNNYYSCTIAKLKLVNKNLSQFDQGNTEMFEDKKDALDYATRKLIAVNEAIKPGVHCGR